MTPFVIWTQVRQRNSMCVHIPMWRGNFLPKKGCPIINIGTLPPAVQKKLNWSRCRLGVASDGPKEPCVRCESKSRNVKGQFWGQKDASSGHVRRSIYSKRLSRGQKRCGCWLGVLDGVHIGKYNWTVHAWRLCVLMTVSPAKTAKWIKMPFGIWTRNHVLVGGPDPLCE